MKLPTTTSKLLALQEATNAELRLRLGEIFKRYRGLAFAARNDSLFSEHWTPEIAASAMNSTALRSKAMRWCCTA